MAVLSFKSQILAATSSLEIDYSVRESLKIIHLKFQPK